MANLLHFGQKTNGATICEPLLLMHEYPAKRLPAIGAERGSLASFTEFLFSRSPGACSQANSRNAPRTQIGIEDILKLLAGGKANCNILSVQQSPHGYRII